jgi:hypothetical protein
MDKLLKYFMASVADLKENSRRTTSFIILFLLCAYAYFFLDIAFKENGTVSCVVLFLIFTLIKEVIADFDILYSGNPEKNKFVKAFQKNLPTKYIIGKYRVNMQEAKSLWFSVFNIWGNKDHKMHSNWENTLKRGFKCRLVYFTITALKIVASISTLSLLIIFIVNEYKVQFRIELLDKYFLSHQFPFGSIIFVLLCLFTASILILINYSDDKKERGCFLRFNEINQINIDWLKDNISSKEDFNNYRNENNNNA